MWKRKIGFWFHSVEVSEKKKHKQQEGKNHCFADGVEMVVLFIFLDAVCEQMKFSGSLSCDS